MSCYRLDRHRKVQAAAKAVLTDLGGTLTADDTERTIATRAARMLAERGVPDTWYYDCPAFVLLGSRSCLSISGRDYVPANEPVGGHNLVTVDLSRREADIWGDCARSFVIERGRHVVRPMDTCFADGLLGEGLLHDWLRGFARPDLTAGELFEAANAEIGRLGFENLEFAGNVGHSIVRDRADRVYIQRGAKQRLDELQLFTFEPHVRRRSGGAWGFKHENVYFFDDAGKLVEL